MRPGFNLFGLSNFRNVVVQSGYVLALVLRNWQCSAAYALGCSEFVLALDLHSTFRFYESATVICSVEFIGLYLMNWRKAVGILCFFGASFARMYFNTCKVHPTFLTEDGYGACI